MRRHLRRAPALTSASRNHECTCQPHRALALGALLVVYRGCRSRTAQTPLRVASPDGRNEVTVSVRDGALYYSVSRRGRLVILPSRLGFDFRGAPALRDSLRITAR